MVPASSASTASVAVALLQPAADVDAMIATVAATVP